MWSKVEIYFPFLLCKFRPVFCDSNPFCQFIHSLKRSVFASLIGIYYYSFVCEYRAVARIPKSLNLTVLVCFFHRERFLRLRFSFRSFPIERNNSFGWMFEKLRREGMLPVAHTIKCVSRADVEWITCMNGTFDVHKNQNDSLRAETLRCPVEKFRCTNCCVYR